MRCHFYQSEEKIFFWKLSCGCAVKGLFSMLLLIILLILLLLLLLLLLLYQQCISRGLELPGDGEFSWLSLV